MPYIGQPPVVGDTTSSFRLLDNIASYTLTFDATSSDIVSTTNNTLTFSNHRFVTAQRVTYSAGGGTEIGGLTDGTAYFIIKVDQNIIKLATSAANANAGTAIALSSGAVGNSHTLNIAFDGINTKFKATYNNGTKAKISRAGQLLLSINGVIQQPQETSAPTVGFGIDADSTIVFSTAPADTDVVFGNIIANTIASFDLSENTVDNFTGDGSTVSFSLSKTPPNNQNVLVTLDGVVQYPSDTTTTRAYSVVGNLLTFSGAPGNGVEIQVRHIGFAGATTSAVTGFYGRTGNAVLTSADDITVQNITGVAATFTGNVSIAGTLTYEDVTNIDSVGLITARSGAIINTGTATTALIVNGDARITGILTVGSSSVTIDGDNNEIKVGTGVTITTSGIVATAGVTTVSAGSTSAPSITPVGDPDTGIFFPSADTIAFGEGGSEAARIDSSGRLLVGTNSDVSGDSTNTSVQIVGSVDNTYGALHLCRNDSTIASSNPIGRIEFRSNDENGTYESHARIEVQAEGGIGDGDKPGRMIFYTTPDGSATPQERMRVDSVGRVRIGNDADYNAATGSKLAVELMTTAGTILEIADQTSGYSTFESVKNAGGGATDYGGYIFSGRRDADDDIKEYLRIDSQGLMGLGTASPLVKLDTSIDSDVEWTSGANLSNPTNLPFVGLNIANSDTSITGTECSLLMQAGGSGSAIHSLTVKRTGTNTGDLIFRRRNGGSGSAESMRIDTNGRLLIGTSSSEAFNGVAARLQVEGTDTSTARASIYRASNDNGGPVFVFAKSRSTSHAVVSNDDFLGQIDWYGSDGSDTNQIGARISARVDGTPGTNDLPTRLEFSTTADGASSPTERMRIGANAQITLTNPNSNNNSLFVNCTAGAFTSNVAKFQSTRSNSNAFEFLRTTSSSGSDAEHRLQGDGNAYADGSWNGGGADYAEYFEWSDGNTTAEDRRGISVVLDGDKIREAVAGEEPIGVISGNPSVVGDAAWNKWNEKYLRDDFGTYIRNEDGERQLNPAYDPDVEYINREDRPEWDCVGLMGKLRIRKGQVTGARWIKMRDVSDSVEEWLVR